MEKSKILFSIVLPAYNRAEFLPKAIDSFLAQTSEDAELIVVDDGSTDRTPELLQTYTHDRIRCIRHTNRERGASRNAGVLLSRGLYVSFLDSDDYLLENHVQEAVQFAVEHDFPPVFHLAHEIRSGEGRLLSKSKVLTFELNEQLRYRNVISCNSIFIRREVALNHPFCERRELSGSEDYELWLRLAAHFKVLHHGKVTSVIVEHEGRTMSQLNFEPVYHRIRALLDEVDKNESVKDFLGPGYSRWKAYRYRYLSLYAAMGRQRGSALRYWLKAIQLYPSLLMKTEGYSTWFKIISPGTHYF